MKRLRLFLTTVMLTLCLMASVSVWAMPPQDGIYEKKDTAGRVTAKMFVITLAGKGEMQTSAGAPVIALQALDGSGSVTEELATCYSWKTDTAGAGETGIRLTGEDLVNSRTMFKNFTPKVFSTAFGEQVNFAFPSEGKAVASQCSEALDGEYVKNPDAVENYPLSAVIYAYERAANRGSFYARDSVSNTYRQTDYPSDEPYHGDYYKLELSNPAGEYLWNVIAEKKLHIVMSNTQHDYRFPFVGDNYHGDPSWAGTTWGAFTGTADTSTNALYLHRHMTLFAPDMLRNPETFIRMTDFYSGEGPEAVTTNAFSVLLQDGSELLQLGTADISDKGAWMRFRQMMGRAAIKGEGVRIREQPNTNCAILGEKNEGTPLTVAGFVRETGEKYGAFKWARVVLDDGTRGYVSGQYIKGINTPYE